MFTGTKENSSEFRLLVLLIGTAIWSGLQLFSWMVTSMVAALWAIFEACQAIAHKETVQDYNLINYPDEISADC
jgi:hypothetical protein